MAGFSPSTLGAARKKIAEAMAGAGAIKGAPCEIQSITSDSTNKREIVVFNWTDTTGTTHTDTMYVPWGQDGATGAQGVQGAQGATGLQGVKGDKGDKGDDGYPFLIYKTYTDISQFSATDFSEKGLMFLITTDDGQGQPVYRYNKDGSATPYDLISHLSASSSLKGSKGDKGDKGDDGRAYTPQIGSVTSGNAPTASVTLDNTTYTATYNFVLPKGDAGQNGTNGSTPTINATNKHWEIDGVDTGVLAEGTNGATPTIDATSKHWFINGTDTGVLAEGTDGADGSDGTTPHIDSTSGNWFIGTTDTGIHAQGDKGDNGIVVPMDGFICFNVDSSGHLCAYAERDVSDMFEIGTDGHLYYLTERD